MRVIGLPRPRRAHPEEDLQAAIAQYLAAVLAPPAWFTAIPAGGGGEWHGKRKKRIGYRAGTPDMMILSDRLAFFLEVKTDSGRLSEAQRDTVERIKAAGCPVAVVRSIDDVAALLHGPWYMIPTRDRKPTPVDALRDELARGAAETLP